jgi:hypothetical protein
MATWSFAGTTGTEAGGSRQKAMMSTRQVEPEAA